LNVIFLRERTIGQWLCNNKPKGIPKRWKQKIYKIPCECVDFILVKQVFGLMKERTNTSMQSKNVSPAIVLLRTSLKQVTQLNDFSFIDGHKYQKNRKIKESLYINAFSNGGDTTGQLLNLEAGTYIDQAWNSLNPMIRKFALRNSYHPT